MAPARGQPSGPSRAAALFAAWPRLAEVVPWMRLGNWPSPLDTIVVRGREVLVKREDLSADGYAGNKIRPLEMVFGAARAAGRGEIWATGAYGSNHALAALVHARRQGFFGGAILWPQPWSQTAADNLLATASIADEVRWARSIVEVPIIGAHVHLTRSAWVMPPGAATPLGALGHAGAALELGHQVGDRTIEAIVLPVGSTCTSAGLLVGTALAHAVRPLRPSTAAHRRGARHALARDVGSADRRARRAHGRTPDDVVPASRHRAARLSAQRARLRGAPRRHRRRARAGLWRADGRGLVRACRAGASRGAPRHDLLGQSGCLSVASNINKDARRCCDGVLGDQERRPNAANGAVARRSSAIANPSMASI